MHRARGGEGVLARGHAVRRRVRMTRGRGALHRASLRIQAAQPEMARVPELGVRTVVRDADASRRPSGRDARLAGDGRRDDGEPVEVVRVLGGVLLRVVARVVGPLLAHAARRLSAPGKQPPTRQGQQGRSPERLDNPTAAVRMSLEGSDSLSTLDIQMQARRVGAQSKSRPVQSPSPRNQAGNEVRTNAAYKTRTCVDQNQNKCGERRVFTLPRYQWTR